MTIKKYSFLILGILIYCGVQAQYPQIESNLDKKIKAFLEENANEWRDMNVPLSDGKILYDIIIEIITKML